jgi:hypothetical protein
MNGMRGTVCRRAVRTRHRLRAGHGDDDLQAAVFGRFLKRLVRVLDIIKGKIWRGGRLAHADIHPRYVTVKRVGKRTMCDQETRIDASSLHHLQQIDC